MTADVCALGAHSWPTSYALRFMNHEIPAFFSTSLFYLPYVLSVLFLIPVQAWCRDLKQNQLSNKQGEGIYQHHLHKICH